MTGLYQAPGDQSRYFALEQAGRIMVFDNRADASQAQVFLDIRDRVDSSSSEMGLLGLALAPDFGTTGIFYVNYTAGNPRRTVIARFTSPTPHTSAEPGSQEVILEVGQPFVNHNGGQTIFGPDGFLYIGFGDGGSARDPMGNGQNRNVLLGKLLRIDVSGTSPGRNYRVPQDNPFAGQSNARDEIWAYGLRNPWRFSFDPPTGALWLADVGQSAREEIDLITKGGNYGWNVMEGDQCLSGSSCNRTGLIPPVFDYATGQDCSITGGFVYRGRTTTALQGAYVYGDYCSGRVWALRYDGSRVTEQAEMVNSDVMISSFALDPAGEIYILQHAAQGGLYKLVP
jgi:glucose/arabinose dehydrogenase